jgi:oligopeptide transport system substrate-binding protein
MFRKPLAFGLAAVVLTGVLAGCGGNTGSGSNPGGSATDSVIRYNMGAEPRYLDPAMATDNVSFSAVMALNEGLVHIGPKGVEPGIASKWEQKDGGLKYVFTIRDGAKFSNGDPITAEDVVYSWTRAVDPRLGSEYAYQLYYIKGGEALNNLDTKSPNFDKQWTDALKNFGAKAVDPKTVEVTLEAPAPYFVNLTAFPTLNVIDKKVVEQNPDWATKPETYVGAGPYKLATWEHKQQLQLVKNENYWDSASVKTAKLDYYMVEDQATTLNMFETGQLDVTDTPAASEAPRLLQEGKLKVMPQYGTYFWTFNTQKAPFDNPKVRKALAMAIDRNAIVTNVMRAGQKPAFGFVPPGSTDADGKTDYRTVGGDLFKEDLTQAKQLLAEAGYPGGKGFPEVTFLYNTSDDHKAIAEAIVEMWKQNLGITTVKMENTEWKVVLDRRQKGDFQLARASWLGDYADPMTFMDMFVTGGGNNDIGWSNKQYDQLIKEAKATADQTVRMAKMHEAEQLFINEMPILPIYYYNGQALQSDNVTGVYRSPLGYIDFKWAEVK